MTAKVIDGKAFASNVRPQVAAHFAKLKEEPGNPPRPRSGSGSNPASPPERGCPRAHPRRAPRHSLLCTGGR